MKIRLFATGLLAGAMLMFAGCGESVEPANSSDTTEPGDPSTVITPETPETPAEPAVDCKTLTAAADCTKYDYCLWEAAEGETPGSCSGLPDDTQNPSPTPEASLEGDEG